MSLGLGAFADFQFNGQLSGQLEFGQYFEIHITPMDNPKSFYISLAKLNAKLAADIGLHVVVQLDMNIVFANIRRGDDSTITSQGKDVSWLKGKSLINVNIRICEENFYIALNGKRRLVIGHQLKVQSLRAIQIGGDIKLLTRLDHRSTYPIVWPRCIDTRCLAFSNDIPMRFKQGHQMQIKGVYYGPVNGEFFIQMRNAHNESDLLLFNPRFKEHVVVCSRGIIGKNAAEERHDAFLFELNKPFCVVIIFKNNELVIIVNGSILCHFAHGAALSDFGGIRVIGDNVRITEVNHILWYNL